MKLLRWMYGKIRRDRLINDNIGKKGRIGSIVEKWWKLGLGGFSVIK